MVSERWQSGLLRPPEKRLTFLATGMSVGSNPTRSAEYERGDLTGRPFRIQPNRRLTSLLQETLNVHTFWFLDKYLFEVYPGETQLRFEIVCHELCRIRT